MFIYFIHILPFPDKAYKMRLYFKFKACDWSKCMHAKLNWCYDASTNELMKMLHGNGESYIDFMYQNIPGILNKNDIIIGTETILSSKNPALLGIA